MTETKKEYAEALFALAAENGNIEEYAQCLSKIYEIINENPQYVEFLASPAIALSERLNAIDAAFDDWAPEYIVTFIKLLCENRRIGNITECIDEFNRLKREASNRVTAKIYSAIELSDKQKSAICNKLEVTYSKKVDAEYIVDTSIIGGVKVEMGDRIIDGSIVKNLKKVKGVMNG